MAFIKKQSQANLAAISKAFLRGRELNHKSYGKIPIHCPCFLTHNLLPMDVAVATNLHSFKRRLDTSIQAIRFRSQMEPPCSEAIYLCILFAVGHQQGETLALGCLWVAAVGNRMKMDAWSDPAGLFSLAWMDSSA